MKKMIGLVVVLMLVAGFASGCGGSNSTTNNNDPIDLTDLVAVSELGIYGPDLDPSIEYVETTVEGIFVDPELYEQYVVLDVEMVNVCPAGCWFFIQDFEADTNVTLYVSRNKDNFTVPMETQGGRARVWGKVGANNRGEILEGHRVEMLD
jgi:hypothetical protein